MQIKPLKSQTWKKILEDPKELLFELQVLIFSILEIINWENFKVVLNVFILKIITVHVNISYVFFMKNNCFPK